MTTCSIILTVISCTMTTPAPSPAEAAAILTASVPAFVYVPRRIDPVVEFGDATDLTSGPWAWPATPALPERRLDGTLLSDPITVYGSFWPYAFTDYGFRANPRAAGAPIRHRPAQAVPNHYPPRLNVRTGAPAAPVRPPSRVSSPVGSMRRR